MGLIGTLELVRDKGTQELFDSAWGVAAYAGNRALAHGVITRALGDTVNLCPPLIINADQIRDLLTRVGSALDDMFHWLKRDGRIG